MAVKTAFIYIEGDIVPDFTNDVYYDYPHTSMKGVRAQLAAYPDAESIQVIINSFGGQITEGFAIYDFLKGQNKPITTVAFGACMSMATVIFMAGSVRLMADNAQFMVHMPIGGVYGNQDDIESYLNWIKQDTERIINLYVGLTGQSETTIAELLRNETFLTAQQCLDLGFATGVQTPAIAKAKAFWPKELPKKPQAKTANNKMKIANTKEGRIKAAMKAMAEGQAVQNKEFALTSGETLDIDTAVDFPTEGDKVRKGGEAAPDGSYELGGDLAGVTVETKGGEVASVKVPENLQEAPVNSGAGNEEILRRLEALEAENKQLRATQAAYQVKTNLLLGSKESADINTNPAGHTITANRAEGNKPKTVQEEVMEQERAAKEKKAA